MRAEPAARLLGPDGRPVRRRALRREVAAPTLAGARRVWPDAAIAPGLTPERLAGLLQAAAEGDAHDYLALAEEMEERDPHYASVLGTRKRAVAGLAPVVEAASDAPRDRELAEALRAVVRRPEFGDLVDGLLDALGKGYSAVEIVWNRGGERWLPARYQWRDPRFFRYDRADGRTLRLLDDAHPGEGAPLPWAKFVTHTPRLKAGLPARGGLARLAAAACMCKAYALTDWVAFAEVFGMPLRVGRYGPQASEEEIRTLAAAVANLGTDAAAVMPESMRIEFAATGAGRGGADIYERLAAFLDRQVSKAVLGQTASSEGTPGRLGSDETQEKVRQDILRADARQLENTLNRDLARPFLDLNFGAREADPRIALPVRDPEDVQALAAAVAQLAPLGLRPGAAELRERLGLSDPAEGAAVLAPPAAADPAANALAWARNRAGGAEAAAELLEGIAAAALEGWRPHLEPLAGPLRELAERAASYEEFLAGLPDLLADTDLEALVRALASAAFQARGLGDARDG